MDFLSVSRAGAHLATIICRYYVCVNAAALGPLGLLASSWLLLDFEKDSECAWDALGWSY